MMTTHTYTATMLVRASDELVDEFGGPLEFARRMVGMPCQTPATVTRREGEGLPTVDLVFVTGRTVGAGYSVVTAVELTDVRDEAFGLQEFIVTIRPLALGESVSVPAGGPR